MSRRKEQFRIDLIDEDIDYYEAIKEHNQFRKNIDVFRHALKTTYELEQDLQSPFSVIPAAMKEQLADLLNRDFLSLKFQVHSIEDAIRKGVEQLIDRMEEHKRQLSLFNWDVRSQLSGEQKDVAMVIYELQQDSETQDVTVNEVAHELGVRNISQVESIMDEFVSRNLLEVEVVAGKKRYHAAT